MSQVAHSSWRFSMKNLGGLQNGCVDVKPLTILCGPNNTGKTWAMYAIYGFLNNSSAKTLHGVDRLVYELNEQGIAKLNVEEWLTENFESTIRAINQTLKSKLPGIFNSKDELFKSTQFNWDIDLETLLSNSYESEFTYSFSVGSKNTEALNVSKQKNSQTISFTLLKNIPLSILRDAVNSLIYNHLLDKIGKSNTFLIPAERNGLHLFYRELSSRRTALLHHASRDELDLNSLLRDVLGSKYAKPIADYIDWLNELTTIKKNGINQPYHDLAEELKKLVGGRYQIDAEGNINFTPRKKIKGPDVSKMDLHLTSSTVKSLFGLWFYLEYQAKEHDVLMIDEPELNLHPSNQRAVARFVGKMINRGINVMVSTHSDYFIRELNSLIMLGSHAGKEDVKSALLNKHNISSEALLTKEKVAAYVFDKGELKSMEISDEGIVADTFDEQINQLNDSSDDIYFSYVTGEEI